MDKKPDWASDAGGWVPGRHGTGAEAMHGIMMETTPKQLKEMTKFMKSMKKAAEKAEDLGDVLDKLSNVQLEPVQAFLVASENWFAAGGADGMESLAATLFNEANITIARELTTEFGRLATEGLAGLLTAANNAIPGLTGLALALVAVQAAFGWVGLAIAAVLAGIQWLIENWDAVVDGWTTFWDTLFHGDWDWFGIGAF